MDEEFDIRDYVNNKSRAESFSNFDNDKFLETCAQISQGRLSESDVPLFKNHIGTIEQVAPPTFTTFRFKPLLSGVDPWHLPRKSLTLPVDLQERYDRFSETQRAICYLACPEYSQAIAEWEKTGRQVNWKMLTAVEYLEKFFAETNPNNLGGH